MFFVQTSATLCSFARCAAVTFFRVKNRKTTRVFLHFHDTYSIFVFRVFVYTQNTPRLDVGNEMSVEGEIFYARDVYFSFVAFRVE